MQQAIKACLLYFFNWRKEAVIPLFLFSSSFSQDGTCYYSGPYFQPLEMWESNNNVETMLAIDIFI